MITQENITVGQRLTGPTPKFFKTLRTVLFTAVGIATAIVTAPVALPAIVTTVAGYIIAAGTVAGGTLFLPTDFKKLNQQQGRPLSEAIAEETRWAEQDEARSKEQEGN